MAFIVDENGNIELVQGDNGMLVVEGIPTDKDYIVYFSIYDSGRNVMGSQIQVSAYGGTAPNTTRISTVTFAIPASLTDLLTVQKRKEYTEYYYGIKICEASSGTEDTLMINDNDIGDVNTITVYPKKVEGT